MTEPDLSPVFESVAHLVDGDAGDGQACPVPVLAVGENGEVEIRHIPQDEHDCPEYVDVAPDMGPLCVVDDEACPCALYGTPCRSYEVTVDARSLTVGEAREVPLPVGHAPGVVAMEVIASAPVPGLRTVRVTGPANMDPIAVVASAVNGRDGLDGEGPACADEDCTCGFGATRYPALVRCADPLCPLPPIELIEYEDSVAWARIHQLTGCSTTHAEIVENGSGEISR